MRLRGRKKTDGSYFYATTLSFRIICILFSFILGTGFLSVVMDGGGAGVSYIPPLFILFLSLCGALYVEKWIFSPVSENIISYFGIWPVVRRRIIPCADIRKVVVRHFRKGTMKTGPDAPKRRWGNAPMVVLSLETFQDGKIDIEIISERVSGGRTEQTGRIISELCGLPFDMDRPYDQETQTTLRDI
ncbi:hypothetical protein [Parasphaerochaeta coccoides]|uniref:Uncharacterized protein n=1 Tax=Parasphaerochaeta coccoides (strain ATCC BAA-1237 / DSM 17374 / SPN1) TaxID=760011 RepID=F4GLL9_PARC1|nr:hypothetical protein [Parasphaerochaeta coccoides]AEC02413.1 hypothetical protein Spico_1200 [Parasphaerochaeta coccoides DSM 17374]